jgi:hypothetical protein
MNVNILVEIGQNITIIFLIIFIFMLPCEQHLIWFSSKKNLCPISYKCDQCNHSPMNIQRCILCIVKDIFEYILGFTNVFFECI